MTKTDYIPELSEIRMVRRAPESPFAFTEDDRDYIGSCLADVQAAFGLKDFAGLAADEIPARALIRQFIDWWRSLEPVNEAQQEAHGRLPAAIRLARHRIELDGRDGAAQRPRQTVGLAKAASGDHPATGCASTNANISARL